MKINFREIREISKKLDNDMVFIQSGGFKYGISKKEREKWAKYCNAHPDMLNFHSEELDVITDSFYIDRYPVTKIQFINFMMETDYKIPFCGWQIGWFELGKENIIEKIRENNWMIDWKILGDIWEIEKIENALSPCVGVNYCDAVEYAKWLNKRLPTEIEWEKAARGTDGRIFPWGNEFKGDEIFLNNNYISLNSLIPVGSFKKNRSFYGVMDMSGIVMEWVKRVFPGKSKNGKFFDNQLYCLAGGSLFHRQIYSHFVTSRFSWSINMRIYNTGFRCVSDEKNGKYVEFKIPDISEKNPEKIKISKNLYLKENIKLQPMDWPTVKIYVPWFPESVWILDCPESRWNNFGGANDWPYNNHSLWKTDWEKENNKIYYHRKEGEKELEFQMETERNLIKYKIKVKKIKGELGSFCLKTLSPFFSSQEGLTQNKIEKRNLISCSKLPIDDSGNLSFLWSLGKTENGLCIYKAFSDDSFVVISGPDNCSIGGNLWPPCTHLRGENTEIKDEIEVKILFFIGKFEELKREIKKLKKGA